MRVLIVGSCVSRDTFTRLQRYGHELVAYEASQSLASARSAADPELIDSSAFSSQFQLNAITSDFTASLFSKLRQQAGKFDVLLWDLIDERRGLLELEDGSLVTFNYELVATGQSEKLPVKRHIEFGTDEHFSLWSAGFDEFMTVLRETGADKKLILIAPQFARKTVQGESLENREGIHSPTWLAANYERYLHHIEQDLDVSVIRLPQHEILADRMHKWGQACYHYSPMTECMLAEAISRQMPLRSLTREQYASYEAARQITRALDLANPGITEINEIVDGLPLQAKVAIHSRRDPLLAMFNGAIDPERAQGKPVYQRFTWQSDIEANTVFFHDSTQTLHPELRISWGMGDGVRTLAPLHAGALQGLHENLHPDRPDDERLFLFGSSSGGFQALRVASLLPGSQTMVNNPQLDWLKYEVRTAVQDVLNQVFPKEAYSDFRSAHPTLVSLLSLWQHNGSVPSFVYLLNTLSSADMKFQYSPLLNWLSEHSLTLTPPIAFRGYADPVSGHSPLAKDPAVKAINDWLASFQ